MAHPVDAQGQSNEAPLLSGRLLFRLGLIVALLLVLTATISIGGRWLGQRLAIGSHTDSVERLAITLGDDTIGIEENAIRFREQRHAGAAERVDLYLAWPEMAGYSAPLKDRFDDVSRPDGLIFLQISESTMSRDMSGRVEPIYQRLFAGNPERANFGLTLHRMAPESGYGREVILTAARESATPYAVRCLLPGEGQVPTGGDCQRDIQIGQGLTVLYRFSSTLLPQWQGIDAAVQSYVQARLRPAAAQPAPRR